MGGVPKHDCLLFGQVELHDRHGNGHRLQLCLRFGDDHGRRRMAGRFVQLPVVDVVVVVRARAARRRPRPRRPWPRRRSSGSSAGACSGGCGSRSWPAPGRRRRARRRRGRGSAAAGRRPGVTTQSMRKPWPSRESTTSASPPRSKYLPMLRSEKLVAKSRVAGNGLRSTPTRACRPDVSRACSARTTLADKRVMRRSRCQRSPRAARAAKASRQTERVNSDRALTSKPEAFGSRQPLP